MDKPNLIQFVDALTSIAVKAKTQLTQLRVNDIQVIYGLNDLQRNYFNQLMRDVGGVTNNSPDKFSFVVLNKVLMHLYDKVTE